jgi:O-acetylhomoserine/O-acetylserine sulfhydrylase-like pyridoxal-dependent enzyme
MEILFADDCELFAESEEALNIMVNIFDRVAMVFAQELSIPKTKVMVVERINAIQRARTIPS